MKADGEKIASLTCYDASFAVLLDEADVDRGAGRRLARHGDPGPRHDRAGHHGSHRVPLPRRGARSASPVPDGRPAFHELSVEGSGTREFRAPDAGGRRQDGEAGKRRQLRPRSSSSWRATTSRCARIWGSGPSRCTRPAAFACRAASRTRRRGCSRARSAWRPQARTSCCSSAFRRSSGKRSREALHVPVIGIGAGPGTDGQILVLYDILDITTGRKPRFVQNFMDGAGDNREALKRYVRGRAHGRLSRSRALLLTAHGNRHDHRGGARAHARLAQRGTARSPSCRPWAICTQAT